MDPIYHFAPNPFPAHLREELPYPTAPWLVSRELFKRLAAAPEVAGKLYKKIELQPDNPEAVFVQRYYEHNPPAGKGIRHIYVIHSGYQTEGFEAELRKCEQEAAKFKPNWSRENEAEHRDEVYAEWQRIADQFIPLEIATSKRIDQVIHARVLPLWHGTSQNKASSICETGFTFFGNHHISDPNAQEGEFVITDRGFFGHGIYFTDSPSYAAKYTQENILMLAFVAMRTPFPIVSDRPHPAKCADMLRFEGNAIYQTYNAHFIPVTPVAEGSKDYYPCQFEQPECNEYVIKAASQTLARYQVEIGDGFPLFQAIITQDKNNLPLPKRSGANEVTSEVLIEKLRAHYTAICTDLPLPMSEATFPLKELFTQLVILESKLVEQKEKETDKQDKEKRENSSRDPSLLERDSLAEAMADLQETTKPISMADLFAKKESAKKPKKVLLIGRAGIGKTTLIDRIALGWTEGEMFPQFDAVFRLVLRELNDFQEPSQNIHWLAAAISHAIYKDRDQFHDVLAYIQQHQNRILILLDGLDEASPELIRKIDQLLQMDLHILVSSRPGVPAAIKNRTDRQIENTGFSRKQMEEYTAKFFARVSSDPNQTTPFLNAIRGNHNLFNLAHTPLQLQMLCTLWEQGAKEKGFGATLTELYTKMFEQLYLWHVRKQNPYVDTSDLSIDKKLIEGLGKIALAGLEARQLMLSEATLKDVLEGTGVTIAQLRATGLLKKSGKDYTFFHLTFQEYLIAYHVSLLSSKEQWDFIRANRYKPHYRLVMSFLAGRIYQTDRAQDKTKTKHYFETLFCGEVDLAGFVQLELTLRSAAECPSLHDWVNDTFGVEETLRKLLVAGIEHQNEVYGNKILKNLFLLCQFRKMDIKSDWLTADFKKMYQEVDSRERVLNAILELLPIINMDDEIFNKIVTFSSEHRTDEDSEGGYYSSKYPRAALNVLENIGICRRLDKTIICKVVELLTDRDEYLRNAAGLALGKIGTDRRLDKEIISKIVELLADSIDDTRFAAINVLKTIGANGGLNPEIISKIVDLLVHSHKEVQSAAVSTLGIIGERRKLDETIIFKIVDLFKEDEVRFESEIAFRQIIANKKNQDETTVSTIISMLVKLLVHQDENVGSAALKALGEIGAIGKLNETVISKIVEFLVHHNENVRSAAIHALGHIGTNGKIHKTHILKIVEYLNDCKWEVRYAATLVLGNIGANIKLDTGIVLKIVNSLTDRVKNSFNNGRDVRNAAAQALEKIAANGKLDEIIIPKIAELLTHRKRKVRYVALKALGKIGAHGKLDKATISKIIACLVDIDGLRVQAEKALGRIGANGNLDETFISEIATLLADGNMYVRSTAARLLGIIGANVKLDGSIISDISKLLAHDNKCDPDAAIEALGRIGTNITLNDRIISKIAKFLPHENSHTRSAAIAALGSIGAKQKLDETIISKIAELLADNEGYEIYAVVDTLEKISLSYFIDHSLANAKAFLEQAFLRHAVTYLEEREKKVYLVILEKGKETRIPLANPEAFIEIANQSTLVGPFVRLYSKNKHLKQLTFFN